MKIAEKAQACFDASGDVGDPGTVDVPVEIKMIANINVIELYQKQGGHYKTGDDLTGFTVGILP